MNASGSESASGVPTLALVESDEHRMIRTAVRDIVAPFGHRYFADAVRREQPPTELWNALAAHGYTGVNVPERYGGGGLGLTELAIVEEEISAAGCPLLTLLVSPAIVGTIVAEHGSEEQRERWLPGIGSGEERHAFAITEPDAGSNTHMLSTRATRRGDRFVLRGTKTFISAVEDAQAILVVATSGEVGSGNLSLFIVDVDAPGLERQRIRTEVQTPEHQWTLFFDDVELGPERLVGAEGEGMRLVFGGLNPERIMAAMICTGVGRYALEKAAEYARERTVWGGRPIGVHQGLSHPLAEAKIALEAARLMAARAAALHDCAGQAGEASNMAKFLAAEAGLRCLDQAIQTHGGNGLATEYGLADLWFAVRVLRTAPVSREMILNYVAQHSLGLPRSY
jgi:alkylation response protein AidB-like acyl-CoA dehydrogenase